MQILLKSPIITHRTRELTKPKYGRHQKSLVKPDFRINEVRISEIVLYLVGTLVRGSRCATSWCDLDLNFDLAIVTLTYKILSGL